VAPAVDRSAYLVAEGVSVIEIENITKVYQMGQVQVHALCGVSLKVEQGEWVAIMGPSGSGKSTLMHIVGCLDTPTSGAYRLNGVEVDSMDENQLAAVRNQQIGFVFQTFNLLPRTNALRQVMLPMQYARNGARVPLDERERRARAELETVGLGDRMDHHPTELSGGEQQRVALARAMVNQPALILADEPTGNLDSASGDRVLEALEQMRRETGTTLVVVTHDSSVAARADRVLQLHDGQIVQ